MKSVIIVAGDEPAATLLKNECVTAQLIICADGGANCLFKHKDFFSPEAQFLPKFIIGDCDSIDSKALDFFRNKNVDIELHSRDKAHTDAHLALKKAIALGAKKIVFLGCFGGRIDQILSNLGLLAACLDNDIDACIKDEQSSMVLIERSRKIHGKKGMVFSLQAYSDVVEGLSIIGSKFELKNYNLKLGDHLTLSNEFLSSDKEVTIEFQCGRLLLIVFSAHAQF